MLTLSGVRQKRKDKETQGGSLKIESRAHQRIAMLLIEIPASHHRDESDDQNPKNRGHGESHQKEKQISHCTNLLPPVNQSQRFEASPMSILLEKIHALNTFTPEDFSPFRACGIADLGFIRKDYLEVLRDFPDVFIETPEAIELAPTLDTYEKRTQAFEVVVEALDARNIFTFKKMREMYPVHPGWGRAPVFEVERNATLFLGIRTQGVHINGYSVNSAGNMTIWLQERAAHLGAWPGMLDQMAAGGQPVGLSVRENMIKEGGEEALLPPEMMERAVSVGTLSYCLDFGEGLRRDTIFLYDLKLPEGVIPRPDGEEVAAFHEIQAAQALAMLYDPAETRFKPNADAALIDFFIRHGIITPDNEPDYVRIVKALRT